MPIGPESAHQPQRRVEDLLRTTNDDAAGSRVAARIQIEVANFAPVAFVALLQFSAVGAADVELAGNVAEAYAMGLFEMVRRRHRQVSEWTLVVVVELDEFEVLVHESPPQAIAEITRKKKAAAARLGVAAKAICELLPPSSGPRTVDLLPRRGRKQKKKRNNSEIAFSYVWGEGGQPWGRMRGAKADRAAKWL